MSDEQAATTNTRLATVRLFEIPVTLRTARFKVKAGGAKIYGGRDMDSPVTAIERALKDRLWL